MKKRFCDSCEVEITPGNDAGRMVEIRHKSSETSPEYQFNITWGNNLTHGRVVIGDGDLCEDCFNSMLLTYLEKAGAIPEPWGNLDTAEEDEEDEEEDKDEEDEDLL